jgi:Mg-chelatase subunit ChlD
MASIASNIMTQQDVAVPEEKESITVLIVLDVSHSMFSWILSGEMKKAATEFLSSCKSKYENATVIFTQFGSNINISEPMSIATAEVPKLETDGMTALYEATCKTIEKAKTLSEKGILFIITDGQDNSSKTEYSSEVFKNTISDLKKKEWEICFIGSNDQIIKYGIRSGIPPASCAAYDDSQPGSMLLLSRAVSNMMSSKDKTTPLDIRSLSTPPSRPQVSGPPLLKRSRAVGHYAPSLTPKKLDL